MAFFFCAPLTFTGFAYIITYVVHQLLPMKERRTMPPKAKFKKEEIVSAALDTVREKGFDALTTREVAAHLGVSTRPIFTFFKGMQELRAEVFKAAENVYRSYAENGLSEKIPFFGFGKESLNFVYDEPELYRMLFLSRPTDESSNAVSALEHFKEIVREPVMRIYKVDEKTADWYFFNMWIISHSLSSLIVNGNCPYSRQEMTLMLTQHSLGLLKGIKEIDGFVDGSFDRNAEFEKLLNE